MKEPLPLDNLGQIQQRNSVPVLDPHRISELKSALSAKFVNEIMDMFASQSPELISEIRKSCEITDTRSVRDIAHKLKGSCATVGASRMQVICGDIQNLAEQSDPQKLREIVRLTDQLTVEFLKVEKLLGENALS